jgi:hypothetical protein
MHFGRVKIGDHYSVSPEATLGPTQGAEKNERRRKDFEREDESQRSEQPRSD